MKQFLFGLAVGVLVTVGVVGLTHKTAPEQVLGSTPSNENYNPVVFYNTLTTKGQVFGNISNSSTTPTTSLASMANVGHITIGTGQTTQNASTTAVDANSIVQVQQELTSPIAGVTCNSTVSASSSEATSVYASTTNVSVNGFKLSVQYAPVTNPFCFSYRIVN